MTHARLPITSVAFWLSVLPWPLALGIASMLLAPLVSQSVGRNARSSLGVGHAIAIGVLGLASVGLAALCFEWLYRPERPARLCRHCGYPCARSARAGDLSTCSECGMVTVLPHHEIHPVRGPIALALFVQIVSGVLLIGLALTSLAGRLELVIRLPPSQ